MIRLLMTLLLAAAPFAAVQAQTYEKLWADTDEALRKDLPKTALRHVEAVYDKAARERDEAQMLRALVYACRLKGEVSPDSLSAARARILDVLRADTAGMAAGHITPELWWSALAQEYVRAGYFGRHAADTAAARRAAEAFAHSVRPDAFGHLGTASAKDYAPLLTEGRDSRLFGNDLLSLLARTYLSASSVPAADKAVTAGQVIRYYLDHGNRHAALLFTLDSIALQDDRTADVTAGSRYRALTRVAKEYADLDLNIETYIALVSLDRHDEEGAATDSLFTAIAREGLSRYGNRPRAAALRNYLAGKEEPAMSLQLPAGCLYPGRKYGVAVRGRHVTHAELRLTRLDLTAAGRDKLHDDFKKLEKLKKGAARTFRLDRPELPAYAWWNDSLHMDVPETGIYLCELYASGRILDRAVVNVSRIRPLILDMPGGKSRVVLLDAVSGKPVADGKVTAYTSDMRRLSVHATGSDGEVTLAQDRGRAWPAYYAESGKDAFAPAFRLNTYGSYGYRQDSLTVTNIDLFPSRAIYRPGQQVRFGGVAYSRRGDACAVLPGMRLDVALLDVNRKRVDSLQVVTDGYGNFGGTFRLPAACLPGRFAIEAKAAPATARTYVQVEEYKRPTFTAEAEEVRRAYAPGDTVDVAGMARTYTDLPVEGARVRWSVSKYSWFRMEGGAASRTGETVTDAEGRFTMPVVLECTPGERDYRPYNYFYYTVNFDVTAENGETASGSYVLRTATRPSWLQADWPASLCKERLPRVVIRQTNAAGTDIPAAGHYAVKRAGSICAEGTYRTGEAFTPDAFAGLPSGKYRIVYKVSQDGGAAALPVLCDSTEVLLFSETDTRPAAEADFWNNVRMSARGDTACVMVGSSCDDVTLFYDILAAGKVVESRRIVFSDSLLRFTIPYEAAWGDGARACFAFVKNGRLHEFGTEIRKPLPDKRLVLRWSSFRSRLTPGSDEEWRLSVTHPDGRPADAVLTARLYDASLDALASSRWNLGGLGFPRAVPYMAWRLPEIYPPVLSGTITTKRKNCPELAFTQWDDKLFGPSYGRIYIRGGAKRTLEGRVYGLATQNQMTFSKAEAEVADEAAPMMKAAMAVRESKDAGGGAEAAAANVQPRTNFAETAYFHPALRTGADGIAVIAFTLPQSLTTWKFDALAHTRDMDYGTMDTTVVARKEFMVQPALPRFVRRGDRTELPVTLRNLSEKDIEVALNCLLTDARSGAEVARMSQKLRLGAGKSQAVTFPYAADAAGPLLVCRITAAGAGFSDGEEHYLPVLSDLVSVTRTLPFTMNGKGRRTLRIDTLWQSPKATDRRLTVETAGNPLWYAVTALSVLARESCYGASDWATRYYALAMGGFVARMNPELAETLRRDTAAVDGLSAHAARFAELAGETPWLREAEGEAERAAALRGMFDEAAVAAKKFTALDNLRALQLADGSWGWYKGMPSNTYITLDVAVLLARAARMAGDEDADDCLRRALDFLKKDMARRVADMKREEKKTGRRIRPGETELRYLYLRTLAGLAPDKDAEFLLERTESLGRELTMYDKALAAVVLFDAGRTSAAQDNLNSLLEHTVSTPEMGTYFDTDRAQWSWNAYRIPTQTAAIEALLRMKPSGNADIVRMRQWLVQSRRTQMWETSRATADAVHALLANSPFDSTLGGLGGGAPLYYTLEKGRKVVGLNAPSETQAVGTVNFSSRTYDTAPAVEARTLTLSKTTDGLSWGSVRATYTLPAADVAAAGKGFTLSRRFEVLRGGEWQALRDGEAVHRGDRVRQVFDFTAERDYDFVALKSSRPACLEPARPLSGYAWHDGMGCYRVVRDASTEYFFEKVRKGKHVFTEECLTDRIGTYTSGLAGIACVYAPEFCAQTAGFTLRVVAE